MTQGHWLHFRVEHTETQRLVSVRAGIQTHVFWLPVLWSFHLDTVEEIQVHRQKTEQVRAEQS